MFHQLLSDPNLPFLAKLLHGISVVMVGNILNVHQKINNTERALINNCLNNYLNGVYGT